MMGSRAYIGFLSALFLVLGNLAAADDIPADSQKPWKFIEQLKYTEDDRKGNCFSFDLSGGPNPGDTFTYLERHVDGTKTKEQADVKSVRDKSHWFCVEYTLPGDSSSRYVWMSKEDNQRNERRGVRASDCAGDAPEHMYSSPMESAMCGDIPSDYTDVFRFNYDDNANDNECLSFKLDSSLKPSDFVSRACFHQWGNRVCYSDALQVEKINSKVDGDDDWTCVGLRLPEDGEFQHQYLELWLGEDGQKDQAAVFGPDGRAVCAVDNPPPVGTHSIQGKECPSLPVFNEVKHFQQSSECHSFDFTTEPYVGSTFQYCRDREDTWAPTVARCLEATTEEIRDYDSKSGPYCVEFKWGPQADIMSLRLTGSGSDAAVEEGECPSSPSSPGNTLEDERCPGLPEQLQDIIRFRDFDGQCHSFDFSNNPPAGGQKKYSEFGYCNGGYLDGANQQYQEPNCDGKATLWTIQKPQDDWYCLSFNTSISTPGEFLWLNEKGSNAVLSSDCLAKPVKDFRQSKFSKGEMCRALPQPLRKQWRFWDRNVNQMTYPVCTSFDFTKPLIKEDQATGFYEDFDEFVYCRGVGGQRNCTVPRGTDSEDMHYASVEGFDHNDLYSWSCVHFSSPESEGALWLSDDGERGVFKSGDSCNDAPPVDVSVWSALERGKCPVMPENTRKENQVMQGAGRGDQSGSCGSLDFTGHPGYDDNHHDTFEFCTGNGHCNNAQLFNITGSGGSTCVSFAFETAYGLPDKHRSFIISDDGSSGKLVANCKNMDGVKLTDVTHRMCERLPGELQKGFFFLQDGTRATLELSHNPNEQNTSFVFCGNYRSANEVCRCAQLKHVVNPDDDDKNWYCMTFEFDSAYGIDGDHYLWMNPHYYGWNNGAAQFEESCDVPHPSPTSPGQAQGDFQVREAANIPNVCPTATPSPSPGGGGSSALSDNPGGVAGVVVGSLAGLGLIIGGGIFAKKKLGGKSSAREEVVSQDMPSAVTNSGANAEGQVENAYTHRRSVDNPVRNIPGE